MNSARPATQVLVSLLRMGEQSAQIAFERLARSSILARSATHQDQLAGIARDEQRHDQELAMYTDSRKLRMSGVTRRFFVGLRDRDIRVHLARIAALDGCVCQIVTRVLSQGLHEAHDAGLRVTLRGIRRDEGRHVQITRRTALRYGAGPALLHEIDAETRAAFCGVLGQHIDDFESLGVNARDLLRRLGRAAA